MNCNPHPAARRCRSIAFAVGAATVAIVATLTGFSVPQPASYDILIRNAPHRRRHREPVVSRRPRDPRRHDRAHRPAIDGDAPRAPSTRAGTSSRPASSTSTPTRDAGIFEVPTAENYVRQGVTTLIEGPDGSSPLPIEPFLDKLAALRTSVNFGTFVGQGSVREAGDRERQPARRRRTRRAKMRVLVEQGDERRRVRPQHRPVLRAGHVHADR